MSSPATTIARPLVSTIGCAEHTGLKQYRLRELTRQGLPCVHIGRKLYFDLDAVTAWIDQNLTNGEVTPAPAVQPNLTDHRAVIKALVDAAPPLTDEQCERIRAVLTAA